MVCPSVACLGVFNEINGASTKGVSHLEDVIVIASVFKILIIIPIICHLFCVQQGSCPIRGKISGRRMS